MQSVCQEKTILAFLVPKICKPPPKSGSSGNGKSPEKTTDRMEDTWYGSALQRTPLTSRDQSFVMSHGRNDEAIYRHYCQQGRGDGSGYFYTGWREPWNATFCQLAATELQDNTPKRPQ